VAACFVSKHVTSLLISHSMKKGWKIASLLTVTLQIIRNKIVIALLTVTIVHCNFWGSE
jgi:hypothetical protein